MGRPVLLRPQLPLETSPGFAICFSRDTVAVSELSGITGISEIEWGSVSTGIQPVPLVFAERMNDSESGNGNDTFYLSYRVVQDSVNL